MVNNETFERLAIRQLDQQLSLWKPLKASIPQKGWIRHMRNILKMPVSKLSRLLGVSHSAIFQMEKREVEGRVTLDALNHVAQKLGCNVIYAFIPNDTLESYIQDLIKQKVAKFIQSTMLTMNLEAQGLTPEDLHRQKVLLEETSQTMPLSELWKDI